MPVHEEASTGHEEAHEKKGGAVADLTRARRILRGEAIAATEALELAGRLIARHHASQARRILDKVLHANESGVSADVRVELAKSYARACCLDRSLRSQHVLSHALHMVEGAVDLAATEDPAALDLAGALHKRLWQATGQKHHLVRAVAFYRRAYEHAGGEARGYAGIHAAFLLDSLAHSEEREAAEVGASSEGAMARYQQARKIREDIVHILPDLLHDPHRRQLAHAWEYVTTVAEAYFGLKRYAEAAEWLRKAARQYVPEQELEITARHFGMLARMQEGPPPDGKPLNESPAWNCLRALMGNATCVLVSAVAGKMGLALSGGGFRAALFHIGVLARLAELDVLRSVEVLSCVSGGSIVGAHYYLEVRKLLQEKADDEVTREDYIALVQRLEHDLLLGIQQNIRMRVAADGLAIVRVIFDRDYSRTVRAGELYEQEIYDRITDDKVRRLRDLTIIPKGAPPHFHPRHHNWRRSAKVPMIVLNATTLNTGHNWQFTTTWMGEPPSGIPKEVDSNERLRRLYYRQAPRPHDDISLGKAVAASACVPGIFEPVTLSGLYPSRTVRLVDGGVHDNQGIGGLLDEHCKVILVSDASGQMDTLLDPGTNVFTVLSRADNIARVHIRAAQYAGLVTRCRTALLHHLMFLHLKKDLEVKPVNWIGCQDPETPVARADQEARAFYGVPKGTQEGLAAIRTDLDSFCDQEAYALMLSGYNMTAHEFPRRIEGFPKEPKKVNWRFQAIEPALIAKTEPFHGELHRVLRVARFISFKIWRLAPGFLAGLLLLLGIGSAASWLMAREAGVLSGRVPAARALVVFCVLYLLARLLIRRRSAVPTPFPEILGFLLWVSTLLLAVEGLWYARLLWLWGTGFTVGTGLASWVLAVASAFAGLIILLSLLFVLVFLATWVLRAGKSWSEVAIGLGFLFFLPLANLHLLTYDRWYLWWGRVRQKGK